jgi:hypothetical protein
MLLNLDNWLKMASAFAEKKPFDPNLFLNFRLAPDQYPLARQVQIACDSAKFTAAYLCGKEAPKHPDTEQTMEELHARIKTCVEYLDTFTPADFDKAATQEVRLHFLPGKVILGADYLNEMALPNFYFHVTTAYAIMRHNGVDLGKRDYIGTMKLRDE